MKQHENSSVINVSPGSVVILPSPSEWKAGKQPVIEPAGPELTVPPEYLDVADWAQEVVDFFTEWTPKNPDLRDLVALGKRLVDAL